MHNSTNENRIRKATAAAAAELMNDWNVVESASSAKIFHMGGHAEIMSRNEMKIIESYH